MFKISAAQISLKLKINLGEQEVHTTKKLLLKIFL
jgi:hypothetical protein